jgi:hypothetical protein
LLFLFSLPFPCLVVCWGLCLFVVGWSVLWLSLPLCVCLFPPLVCLMPWFRGD